MSTIEQKYVERCKEYSDIYEHLPILFDYASKCRHITETGVRSVVSSYAFAKALLGRRGTKIVQIDLASHPNISLFQHECAAEGIHSVFYQQSDLECPIEKTDLLFIDTWHIYGHLKRELSRWHEHVSKYIILHDTTVDEWQGETIRNGWNAEEQSIVTGIPVLEINMGLWPAIVEFLSACPEWVLEKRYFNNNGLTVLRRVEMPKTVGFFVRQFSERGTEVAIYDYAHYNETILKNNTIIITFTEEKQRAMGWPIQRYSYDKFKARFQIIEINDISEMSKVIKEYELSFFYTLTSGAHDIFQFEKNTIWNGCKTIKHCVFQTFFQESDFYIGISDFLNEKYNTNIPVISHIIQPGISNETLRKELNIPNDAVVIGRHGGYDQFDYSVAHDAIRAFLEVNRNTYFLFMNTHKFYEHPKIIYIDRKVDVNYKEKFVNTCDAMIHARTEGETFGLAIAEFSIKNKPVITCALGDLAHIRILGDKAVLYSSKEQLIDIFSNIKQIIKSRDDWNAHKLYTPSYIMNLFRTIIGL